ncbi:YHYH domain-containing protein [Oryzomicrobium terrae]|uniref:YHYH domain-containing protein n=1 Tax=Oryzomicrobium terrae TaxID=1735038 RepID=UPI0011ECBA09
MFTIRLRVPALLAIFCIASPAFGHGGGLDSNGCHFERSTGEYHCHRSRGKPAPDRALSNMQEARSPNNLVPRVDNTCYTGPRGGRYRIVNGRKRYGC